jgi:hypothetical protein
MTLSSRIKSTSLSNTTQGFFFITLRLVVQQCVFNTNQCYALLSNTFVVQMWAQCLTFDFLVTPKVSMLNMCYKITCKSKCYVIWTLPVVYFVFLTMLSSQCVSNDVGPMFRKVWGCSYNMLGRKNICILHMSTINMWCFYFWFMHTNIKIQTLHGKY